MSSNVWQASVCLCVCVLKCVLVSVSVCMCGGVAFEGAKGAIKDSAPLAVLL